MNKVPDYDWNYAVQEWSRGLDVYLHRLCQIGFNELNGLVLDAGVGTGQWSDALSHLGIEVVGVDVRLERLKIAKIFLNPDKTHLIRASVEHLPFKKDLFQGIICYGVIMFTEVESSLTEFHRVLEPGNPLYLCWNALGWSLRLVFSREYGRSTRLSGLLTILNTLFHVHSNITEYYSRNRMGALLSKAGFTFNGITYEGHYGFKNSEYTFYPSTFMGTDCVLETVATKGGKK